MAFLNTHKEVENLISAGVSKKMAEAILDLHIKNQEELATKSQLIHTEVTLKSKIALVENSLESEVSLVQTNLKSEISEVRSEIKSLGTELRADIRTLRADGLWLKALLLIILGLISKLVFFND